MRLSIILGRLPPRFQWTVHNIVGHPLSELLYQFGLTDMSDTIHEATVPVYAKDSELKERK